MTDKYCIRPINLIAIAVVVCALGTLLYPIVALLAAMGGAR